MVAQMQKDERGYDITNRNMCLHCNGDFFRILKSIRFSKNRVLMTHHSSKTERL